MIKQNHKEHRGDEKQAKKEPSSSGAKEERKSSISLRVWGILVLTAAEDAEVPVRLICLTMAMEASSFGECEEVGDH